MPITRYKTLLEQSINLLSGYRQGDFKYQTAADETSNEKKKLIGFRKFLESQKVVNNI